MYPNFLIIGAQKGATTWIARRLEEHPDVFMVPEKETHFFNHHYERGHEWYQSRFEEWSSEAAVGEATPGYLNSADAPARIHNVLGSEVKLIASLRHPVDRAYSAFWHYTATGRIAPNTDFRTFFLESDQFGLRSRGDYFTHISRYYSQFRREQMLVLIYDEWKADPAKALHNCLNLLNVDTNFSSESVGKRTHARREIKRFGGPVTALRRAMRAKARKLPRVLRTPLMNTGRLVFENIVVNHLPKQDDFKPLDDEIRQELVEQYLPEIYQLEELLEKDLSVWHQRNEEV